MDFIFQLHWVKDSLVIAVAICFTGWKSFLLPN